MPLDILLYAIKWCNKFWSILESRAHFFFIVLNFSLRIKKFYFQMKTLLFKIFGHLDLDLSYTTLLDPRQAPSYLILIKFLPHKKHTLQDYYKTQIDVITVTANTVSTTRLVDLLETELSARCICFNNWQKFHVTRNFCSLVFVKFFCLASDISYDHLLASVTY